MSGAKRLLWLPMVSICLNGGLVDSRRPGRGLKVDWTPKDTVACLTAKQCQQKAASLKLGGDFYVGDKWPSKGCFSKGKNVFFGTGGTEEEMSVPDLAGKQERVWCDAAADADAAAAEEVASAPAPTTEQPTSSPTKNPTSEPTQSPTKPVLGNGSNDEQNAETESPAEQATTAPTPKENDLEALHHLIDAVKLPTETSEPTPAPSPAPSPAPTAKPTSLPPTKNPTSTPTSTPTPLPTPLPTTIPTTPIPSPASSSSPTPTPSRSPTAEPTHSPTTQAPTTHAPTSAPSDSSSTLAPVLIPLPAEFDFDINWNSQDTSEPQTEEDEAPAYPETSVALSPFTLKLMTDPQTVDVDTNELSDLVSRHLAEAMEANFASGDVKVTAVDVVISSVPNRRRVRRLQSGLEFASDERSPAREHEFTVTGNATFEGPDDLLPTQDTLNSVAQDSFEGDSGAEFVRSLQAAEDGGLRSTRAVSSDVSTDGEGGTIVANYLDSNKQDDPVVSDQVMILSIVFVVGFLLVAIFVFKTRRSQKVELEHDRSASVGEMDEESAIPHFPRYIEVESKHQQAEEEYDTACNFYGNMRNALADPSEMDEEPSNVSALTQPKSTMSGGGSVINVAVFDDTSSQDSQSGAQASQPPQMANLPNVDTELLSVTEKLSVFQGTVSEASDARKVERNSEQDDGVWNLCGVYGDGVNAESATRDTRNSRRPEKRVTGAFWGERPEEFSEYSSQMSANRSMVTGTTGWGNATASEYYSEDDQSRQTNATSRIRNTAK